MNTLNKVFLPVVLCFSITNVAQADKKHPSWKYDSFSKEIECLAHNIYFEARSHPRKGRVAVALVTINRVKSKYYPSSICDVVWQQNRTKTGKLVAQFSWTLDGASDVPKNKKVYSKILSLSKEMLEDKSFLDIDDFTSGSTHYHTTDVKPKWRKAFKKVLQIDNHLFYVNPKDRVANL